MLACLSNSNQSGAQRARVPDVAYCDEKNRLVHDFLEAIHELTTVQSLQTQAVIAEEPDFARFDVLLHFAQERKEQAKYALMAHVESHHCEEA